MSGLPPAIEAERLGRDYGDTRALDALDLQVSPGTLVGLLGPNGAGKTTAMLLLATLLAPTRGTARAFSATTSPGSAVPSGVGWASSFRRPASMACSPSRRTSSSPPA